MDLTGNANVLLGIKSLDHDDWDPNDDQFLYGVQLDIKKRSWPVHLALDGLGSFSTKERNGADVSGVTGELAVGARKIFEELGTVQPYIGLGPSLVYAHTESSVSSNGGHIVTEDTDVGVGLWFGAGVLFRITERFNFGGGVRWSKADVELFRSDKDAGGWHYNLLGGVHF